MKGQVIKSTGSWYTVRDEQNETYQARLRGKFKIKGIKVTNPIAVGDYVDFEETEDSWVITKIHKRENYVIRKATKLSAQAQIIASNIDQAILIVTVKSPHTSMGFIDRFLVTTESFRIPAIIIFNKVDLLEKEADRDKLEYRCMVYESLGYQCLKVSITQKEGLEEINNLLKDKTTLVSGHSGVGKSSFINSLIPDKLVETKDISDYNDKGQHTTTFAEMHTLPFGGKIIDTPGIKEIGIIDMKKEEIGHYFVEFRERLGHCKFNNCLHMAEPNCAIKEGVENGKIAPNRYNTYFSLIEDCEENEKQLKK